MDIRTAILKAADSIEVHPQLFEYSSTQVANPRGTRGCGIGWIAYHFIGAHDRSWSGDESLYSAMGVDFCRTPTRNLNRFFTDRMGSICGSYRWRHDPKLCGSTLRTYADKYHPITDHIPAKIRAIFEPVSAVA